MATERLINRAEGASGSICRLPTFARNVSYHRCDSDSFISGQGTEDAAR